MWHDAAYRSVVARHSLAQVARSAGQHQQALRGSVIAGPSHYGTMHSIEEFDACRAEARVVRVPQNKLRPRAKHCTHSFLRRAVHNLLQ